MATIISTDQPTVPRGTQRANAWRAAAISVGGGLRITAAVAVWEILAYFRRPAAYVMLLAATLIAGWNFSLLVTLLGQGRVVPLRTADDPLAQFLGPNVFLVFSLMAVVPVVTMGMVADERRRGVWEMLLVSPAQPWQVLCGKLAAAWLAVMLNTVPWLCYLAALRWWPGAGLDFDSGYLIGGAIGLATISLSLSAIGIACSTFCRAPFAAGVATAAAMMVLLLASLLPRALMYWGFGETWIVSAERWACWEHLAQFSSGLVDWRIVVGHATVAALLIGWSAQAARWRDS